MQSDDGTSIERIDTLASPDRETDPEYAAMRDIAVERFRSAFSRLPEREQKVAVLLHVYGLTLREIGEVLGVSESRVCQINSGIKRQLRAQIGSEQNLFQRGCGLDLVTAARVVLAGRLVLAGLLVAAGLSSTRA